MLSSSKTLLRLYMIIHPGGIGMIKNNLKEYR